MKMLNAIIFSILLLFPSCEEKPSIGQNLQDRLTAIAKKNHIPTLSVRVKSARINLDFKYQDSDKDIEPITSYGLASTTKFLSALLVLKQVEENKIGLDDPIYNYIDGSDYQNISWFNTITIKQLLNHTSGIPDYTKNPKWIQLVMNGEPPLDYAQKVALINVPDTASKQGHYAYSNSNYMILERIIAVQSNKDAQFVFDGFYAMSDIPNLSLKKPSDNNQAFFAQEENQISNVMLWRENYGYEGGAYGDTHDLSLILRKVFLEKKMLSQTSLDLMTDWVDIAKYKIDYGFAQMTAYGLGLMKYEFNGRVFLGHAGSSLKYQCFAFIEPKTGTEIILQTNCSGKYYNKAFFIDLLGEITKEI